MNLLLKIILPIFLCFISGIATAKSLLDKAQDGHPDSQFELALKKTNVDISFISNWLLIAALQDHQKAIHYLIKFSKNKILIISELKLLNQNSDFIWKLAGDNSNDFSYYSKRGLLSIVYLSTLIYWLNDSSNKMIGTKSFISRAVDGVVDGMSKLKQLSILKTLAQNFLDKRTRPTG